jgi:predicted glycogen debranching enzyme
VASPALPPAFQLGPDLLQSPQVLAETEWLVTNGLGGYAAGTVGGLLTRRYHGLLVTALDPPAGRTVLASKLEETVHYQGSRCRLFTNQWQDGSAAPTPEGFRHLALFQLEGTVPVWQYRCGDELLEKRIWMVHGATITCVQYRLHNATAPLTFSIKAFASYRDHHANTQAGDWRMTVEPVAEGVQVLAFPGAVSLRLLAPAMQATPEHTWYRNLFLAREAFRGLDDTGDHLLAATFQVSLSPGEAVELYAVAGPDPVPTGRDSLAHHQERSAGLLRRADLDAHPPWVRHLALAADQFLVARRTGDDPDGLSIIAGYPWFADWGRDTMIALPGLTLATGRPEDAARILRTYARYVDRGMLPNRFPDQGQEPEYNTVDATLWYVHALRMYARQTGDYDVIEDVFLALEEILDAHLAGTRYGIHVDPQDHLLFAGEPGVQLTWMDARVEGREVTPRHGKPVQVNALWYNALRALTEFAQALGRPSQRYTELADLVEASFERFWNETAGFCFDVIDGPAGDDASLRPNQILAVSLPDSPLTPERQQAVVDACSRALLTPLGLRSLDPRHSDYAGRYGGGPTERDGAYHQGTVWPWLIGPFIDAFLRVYDDPPRARALLAPLGAHLQGACVGQISEIAEGDAPHRARGTFAQAWSVAELLRAWLKTQPVQARGQKISVQEEQ